MAPSTTKAGNYDCPDSRGGEDPQPGSGELEKYYACEHIERHDAVQSCFQCMQI